MIYVTGDLHGDINRFKSKEMRKLRKNDYLIVCGDFGFFWNGAAREKRQLKWIGKRPYHVLFLEGTHDNLDLLEEYPLVKWQGGEVHEISGRLRHLCRGSVFDIEEQALFVFGGGASEDLDVRQEHVSWWSRELPSPEEIKSAWANLEKRRSKVDYIFTHQGSRRIRQFLSMDKSGAGVLDIFLDKVRESCSYTRWFFGGVHLDKVVPPAETAVFEKVLAVYDKCGIQRGDPRKSIFGKAKSGQ